MTYLPGREPFAGCETKFQRLLKLVRILKGLGYGVVQRRQALS